MNRSGSQKALLIISIIDIVIGAFILIFGLVTIFAGNALGALTPAELAEAGLADLTAEDKVAAAMAMSFISASMIIMGIISVIEGILGIRAANNNQKIMPVWVLSIIGLAGVVVGIIMSIVQGTFSSSIMSNIFSLVANGLMFWIANNIKTQAGK